MATELKQRLAEIEARGPKPCAVPGCPRNARRFGSYCQAHDTQRKRTGDAQGHTIRWRALKPYYERALFHIKECERLELKGLPPSTYKPVVPIIEQVRASFERAGRTNIDSLHRGLGRKIKPTKKVTIWLSKMHENELDPRRFMAVIVGMMLMRDEQPEQFVTDLHWWYQTTLRAVRLLETRVYGGVQHPTLGAVGVFAQWYLRNSFAVFCGRMADDIRRRMGEEDVIMSGPMGD